MHNKINRIINKIVYLFIYFFGVDMLADTMSNGCHKARVMRLSKKFRRVGTGLRIGKRFSVHNPQYMSIGKNLKTLSGFRIEAFDAYYNDLFTPDLTIGDDVIFNTDCHIGCMNKVSIGNNVLFASRIYISDHSHGEIKFEALSKIPVERKLVSAGPVIIGDNAWIGEGVCILPGVTIGKNAIIGANSVVTKSIPDNAVAAGVPAMVIRVLQ